MFNHNALRLRLLASAAMLMALASIVLAADARCPKTVTTLENTMVRLAADRIDSVLGAVADSTRALGDTYARLAVTPDTSTAPDAQHWLGRSTTLGHATGFQTWPDNQTPPPPFQAPYPGLYSFNGKTLSPKVVRQLNLLDRIALMFRTAYESFPFSWVYMTTADNVMAIYPYSPLDQVVNNGVPTETVYYQAANFEQRAVGWTPPYLDLVGAGMMITASYPVYDGETLLGVMSRDITLKQLSKTVLSHLTDIEDSRALIIDSRGLAIDASDPDLAAEIDRVNAAASAAVLYYRTTEGVATVATKTAVMSAYTQVNMLVEQVLAQANRGSGTVRLDLNDQHVLAARIAHTSWLVVLILPHKAV